MTMKQRITIEQLDELTDEQKQRLREWWVLQEGDWIADDTGMDGPIEDFGKGGADPIYSYGGRWKTEKAKCLPLLSIGRMIEIISDKRKRLAITTYDGGWEVVASTGDLASGTNKVELCDALWEITREII